MTKEEKIQEELEESICDTCTAGMCSICSERHTSSSYQSAQEEASEYYSNLEKENPIVKNKECNLNDLAKLAFKIDDVLQKQQEKSEKLARMAKLAKLGLKDSDEFKKLEQELKIPQFTGPSEELHDLRIIVKRLRKYKF